MISWRRGMSFSRLCFSCSTLSYLFLDSALRVFRTAMNLSSICCKSLVSMSFLACFSALNLSWIDFSKASNSLSYTSCSYSLAYLSVSIYFRHSVTFSLKAENFLMLLSCQRLSYYSALIMFLSRVCNLSCLSFSIFICIWFNLFWILDTRSWYFAEKLL